MYTQLYIYICCNKKTPRKYTVFGSFDFIQPYSPYFVLGISSTGIVYDSY
jgi:hypothetical protein